MTFRKGDEAFEHKQRARFSINCALTIHRMIVNGAGIGPLSAYLCGPEIAAGRLVRLFADWTLPLLPIQIVFSRHREQTPAARAFIDFLQENRQNGRGWLADPIIPAETGTSQLF